MAKKIIIIEILILTILTLLLGATSGGSLLTGDINFIDEGQFAAWANHMLHGKRMYQDIYITYGPLYVYPVYLIYKFIEESAFSLRAYLLFGSILSSVFCLLIMHKLSISKYLRWTALIVLIIIPILQLRHAFGLLSIYLLFLLIEKPNKYLYMLLGSTLAVSWLVSPDVAIAAGIVAGLYLFLKLISNIREIKVLPYVFTPLLLIFMLFLIWSRSEGWFVYYILNTLDTIKSLSGDDAPLGKGFPNLIEMIRSVKDSSDLFKLPFNKDLMLYWGILFYIILLFYFIQKIITTKLNKVDKQIILLGMFGFILYNILIGRSGIGHFFFVLSPLLIIFTYLTQSLIKFIREKHTLQEKLIGYILISVYFLSCLRLLSIYRPQIQQNIQGLISIRNVYKNPAIVGSISISNSQISYIRFLQEFSKNNISKKSTVFVLTDEPYIYAVIDKVNPTRYDLPFIASSKQNRYEMLRSLTLNPPQYVLENNDTWSVDGINNRKRLPEVSEFLNDHYVIVKRNKNIFIYKLKSDSI